MGVSRSPEQLTAKFNAAAKQMTFVNKDALQAAANVYKAGVLTAASQDVGGDQRVRWSGRNVKLGARYRTLNRGASAQALLTPVPAGVWSAISSGTAPHTIGARRAERSGRRRGGRRKGKTVLKFADGNFSSRPVNHPGTPGKRTWQRGINTAEPAARKVFAAAHRRGLVKVFGRATG